MLEPHCEARNTSGAVFTKGRVCVAVGSSVSAFGCTRKTLKVHNTYFLWKSHTHTHVMFGSAQSILLLHKVKFNEYICGLLCFSSQSGSADCPAASELLNVGVF